MSHFFLLYDEEYIAVFQIATKIFQHIFKNISRIAEVISQVQVQIQIYQVYQIQIYQIYTQFHLSLGSIHSSPNLYFILNAEIQSKLLYHKTLHKIRERGEKTKANIIYIVSHIQNHFSSKVQFYLDRRNSKITQKPH